MHEDDFEHFLEGYHVCRAQNFRVISIDERFSSAGSTMKPPGMMQLDLVEVPRYLFKYSLIRSCWRNISCYSTSNLQDGSIAAVLHSSCSRRSRHCPEQWDSYYLLCLAFRLQYLKLQRVRTAHCLHPYRLLSQCTSLSLGHGGPHRHGPHHEYR